MLERRKEPFSKIGIASRGFKEKTFRESRFEGKKPGLQSYEMLKINSWKQMSLSIHTVPPRMPRLTLAGAGTLKPVYAHGF